MVVSVAALALSSAGCGEPASSASQPRQPAPSTPAAAQQPDVPVEATPATAASTPPAEPLEGTNPAQISAINVAAMVEACFGARPDYRLCTNPTSAGHIQLPPIVDREPEPGEVQILAHSARSYTVISPDDGGTRWTVRRADDGTVVRGCEGAGDACDDASRSTS